MKQRWNKIIKDYLTFSRKERTAVFILILIGTGIWFLPRFFNTSKRDIPENNFQKELSELKISVDSSSKYRRFENDDDNNYDHYRPNKTYDNRTKGELFAFDPNTLDAAGWKRLGLRDKTIQTIENFRSKGGKFRQPEDIKKIYGLWAKDADRLIPFVQIAGNSKQDRGEQYTSSRPPTFATNPAATTSAPRVIDINNADTSALIALPGIGGKLATRIVTFRDKLGGFYTVSQIAEVYGIPDSTFQNIKGRLQCNNPRVRTININTADANMLKTHPYIKWNIANALINFRQQHGNYKNIDDIRKIDIITDDIFKKIAPYLVV